MGRAAESNIPANETTSFVFMKNLSDRPPGPAISIYAIPRCKFRSNAITGSRGCQAEHGFEGYNRMVYYVSMSRGQAHRPAVMPPSPPEAPRFDPGQQRLDAEQLRDVSAALREPALLAGGGIGARARIKA